MSLTKSVRLIVHGVQKTKVCFESYLILTKNLHDFEKQECENV